MNDVASLAGVGLKTVSRYVNGETNINPDLAARISDAIETLDYRRNLAAASIRPGRASMVLGMIISDLANPYFSALARGIESLVRSRGYLLIVASSEEDGVLNDRLVDRLIEQRVDGLFVVPPRTPHRAWSEMRGPLPPAIVLDRPSGDERVDSVLSDNHGGAMQGTRALLACGPRRIAFLGDALNVYTMRERQRGFVDAIAAAADSLPEILIDSSSRTIEQARESALRMLRDQRIEAIFAANNRASMGTLMAFHEVRRRVPLVGFDDFESATIVDPAVSVIRQDIAAVSQAAVDLLLRRQGGWDGPAQTVTVDTTLELRGSESTNPS